jgi:hypothetical protein
MWNQMEDPESASAEAVRLCDDILRDRLDPVANFDSVKAGIEPAWDGPLGNFPIAHEALGKAEIAFYDAERRHQFGTADQVLLHAESQILIARSWHRKPNPKQAFMISYAVIRRLEDLVGGRQVLLEIVARPTSSAVAQAAVQALGPYIASLRRVESHPEQAFEPRMQSELYAIGFDLVTAYLGPSLAPAIIYPGSDALGAQWFYRFVGDPTIPDALVDAFYQLDKRTRPADKRSLITAHARDAEYAARRGDPARAQAESSALFKALELVGMLRHLATIREQGYFAT